MKIKEKLFKSNSKIKSILKLVIILLVLLLIIFSLIFLQQICLKNIEQKRVDNFFTENSQNKVEILKNNEKKLQNKYIAFLEIPSISLKTGLMDKNSKDNTVEKGVEIIKKSDMPDVENGNFILASHSGTSSVSYFNKLNQVKLNDSVNIYYKYNKSVYKIYNIYKVDKSGKISINRYLNQNTITLTTCDVEDDTKQLVVVGNLIKTEKIEGE